MVIAILTLTISFSMPFLIPFTSRPSYHFFLHSLLSCSPFSQAENGGSNQCNIKPCYVYLRALLSSSSFSYFKSFHFSFSASVSLLCIIFSSYYSFFSTSLFYSSISPFPLLPFPFFPLPLFSSYSFSSSTSFHFSFSASFFLSSLHYLFFLLVVLLHFLFFSNSIIFPSLAFLYFPSFLPSLPSSVSFLTSNPSFFSQPGRGRELIITISNHTMSYSMPFPSPPFPLNFTSFRDHPYP